MDEDSNQSSRASSSQLTSTTAENDDGSQHRESDSQMTLTYHSDTELDDADTLRLEESDEEDLSPTSQNREQKNDDFTPLPVESVPEELPIESIPPVVEADSDEDITTSTKKIKKLSQLIDSDSEDDPKKNDENEEPSVPVKRKISKIIDSDSNDDDRNPTKALDDEAALKKQNEEVDAIGEKIEQSMNRFKSLIDSDSGSSPAEARESDNGETKKKRKKLKSKKERNKSKGKAKKGGNDLLASLNLDFSDDDDKSRPGRDSAIDSDGSGSGSGSGSGRSGSGSESGSEAKGKRKPSDGKHGEKAQRMSAKVAMEQMQVIQSESQRMAREAAVTVPYHRPKQHTLQEFLNRRTVFRPAMATANLAAGQDGRRLKAAAAIKMTPEQLAEYAKQLEEREKEAMEFFKSESDEEKKKEEQEAQEAAKIDDGAKPVEQVEVKENEPILPSASEDDNKMETDTIENLNVSEEQTAPVVEQPAAPITMDTELDTLRVSDTEDDALDAMVNKTHKHVEQLLASHPEPEVPPPEPEPETPLPYPEPIAGPSRESAPIDYDLFPDPPKSPPKSLLAQKKAELLANASIRAFPTLRGGPDMVIDLDSNDTSKSPSGAEILFQRFAKCSGKKAKKATTTSLSILSADKGTVEMDTVSFALDPEERDPNGKEPVPGAAFAKLKQSLREKMEQRRRESLRKRQAEMEQAKKLNGEEDDEEEEEILGDDEIELEDDEAGEKEAEEDEEEDEEDIVEERPRKRCDFVDDEAEDDDDEEEGGKEAEEKENEEDGKEETSDEEESEEEPEDETVVNGEKRKSRIIAAFEDSDEEASKKDEEQSSMLRKATTDDLFSTLEGKFTPNDRENHESGEPVNLFWKDTEEPIGATQADDDLLALCSGRFGDTQAAAPATATTDAESLATTQPMTTTPSELALTMTTDDDEALTLESEPRAAETTLFTQQSEHPVDDGELMALCSGTFATQAPPSPQPQPEAVAEEVVPPPPEVITKGKLVIASSDEEDQATEGEKKKKKKRKRRNLNISDDEDSEEELGQEEQEDYEDNVAMEEDNEEDVPERFVDYDSEENEVEVVMTKKDIKQKVATTFLENEAELSESEWGSADEDEKDLDRYDIELGDEEKYDQGKLQEELERIHMRRMLEQDKKEVKTLQDMFFEDEEKDGVGRERQFRWRNVETTFSLDYDKQGGDEENKEEGEGSDGEHEALWRKMRHEREQLLKEKKIDLDSVDLTGTLLDKTAEEEENNSSINNSTRASLTKRKITVIRSKKSSEVTTPKDSSFLITKSTIVQGHKGSFLSRDEETLNKLASLVKVNPETDGASTVVAAKGRNFVFASVSPAVDKMGSKRSLDAEEEAEAHSAKKVKRIAHNHPSATENGKSKKRLLLGQLM